MAESLIKVLLYVCSWLPLPLLHALGRLLGGLLAIIPNELQRISAINIRLCLPECAADQQARLVRNSLVETGKTALETGALWLRPAPRVLRLIKQVNGLEHIDAAREAGRGMILATPHMGAWEMAGLYCAHAYDITCLYRPLRMTGLEQLVNRARSRAGGSYLPATASAIRLLYRQLDAGRVIAMLPDQEPQAGTGIFAPFFGTPALSMVLLSRLAAKNKTPVVFVWCERLGWGRGYHLHFYPAPEAVYSADVTTSVTAVNSAVELAVRQRPEQYQWNYKRFRTRPEGEASLYRSVTSRQ